MRIFTLLFFLFGFSMCMKAQEISTDFQKKRVSVKDTIVIDTVSINPSFFKLSNFKNQEIASSNYKVDFAKSILIITDSLKQKNDSLIIEYKKYPDFLTRRYYQFDPKVITNGSLNQRIYTIGQKNKTSTFTPFEGLNTSGSISRGITTGTNQNTVLDSELDLQISGKIAPQVNLRASIQDSNIPIQESGYSQNLDEFDQIFIELYGKNWNVRAGDVDLVQSESYFASFTKKVQGLSVGATLNPTGNSTNVYAAGALVKGVFTRDKFDGQEGNQGPYKLNGANGELYVVIVSGSESVFVNGIQLQRGENEDYIIDYNAGEIIFNSTFPITSEMRITVEFQYSDQNYSRIIAMAGAKHNSEKLQIGGFLYSENDLKNQELQQSLSDEQKQILSDAGDDATAMYAESAIEDTFDEGKVLYKKEIINGETIYIYSINPEDDLYNVSFTLVGNNLGDYVLTNSSAISNIYEYVAPIDGVKQGNYAPLTQLFAPTKLQIGVINGSYLPSKKTSIDFELAGSKNDENLYSDLDDDDNDGVATRINVKQTVLASEKSQLNAFANFNYLQENFNSIELLYNIEFDRDWNLPTTTNGDQNYLNTGLQYSSKDYGTIQYSFQNLKYTDSYNGNRQLLQSNSRFGKLQIQTNSSYLKSEANDYNSEFLRIYTNTVYSFKKTWSGLKFELEDNLQEDSETGEITNTSQKYKSYEVYTGVGDSTNLYAEIGYTHRVNDSLRDVSLKRVNSSNTYYVKSTLINSNDTKLSLYANYRKLSNEDEDTEDEQSLNSRILYNQFLFNKIVNLNTTYETSSGTLAQQEFTYVEVNAGEGTYTWLDYNGNGVQELNEFEIASYSDEAKYTRVLLPNQIYLNTHQNKFSQIVTLNFQQWSGDKNFKKFLSKFYNQTSYLIDRKIEREEDNFDLNPFNDTEDELAVNFNFKNTIYFNRGKQNYTTSYSYISTRNKNLLSTGLQESEIKSHQVNFNHKFNNSWLVSFTDKLTETKNTSENYESQNYKINGFTINPELSYLLSQNTRFNVFYQFQSQDNKIGDLEKLQQNKLGTSFTFNNTQKYSFNGELNYIYNNFEGDSFSTVGYQMLQGLQAGKNYTWSLLAQKKLTDYLDLNLSYFGRKSEGSTTIHTGTVQLRAYF